MIFTLIDKEYIFFFLPTLGKKQAAPCGKLNASHSTKQENGGA